MVELSVCEAYEEAVTSKQIAGKVRKEHVFRIEKHRVPRYKIENE